MLRVPVRLAKAERLVMTGGIIELSQDHNANPLFPGEEPLCRYHVEQGLRAVVPIPWLGVAVNRHDPGSFLSRAQDGDRGRPSVFIRPGVLVTEGGVPEKSHTGARFLWTSPHIQAHHRTQRVDTAGNPISRHGVGPN